MAKPLHTIVIAGTHSGVGKTSVAVGVIGALRRRGLVVQPFKVGPDFIDPAHHARAAGRPAHNLDGWMLTRESNLELYSLHTADADVAVVEGVMGLFDGSDPRGESGSTAEMAKWLGAPVVLVIDASALARSAAALVHGYATFDPDLRVDGVIANRVGSDGHARLLADALEGRSRLLGWMATDPELAIPERHLGLHLPGDDSAAVIERLADVVEESFDLDGLLRVSRSRPRSRGGGSSSAPSDASPPRIGIARDEAFSFYYEDNLALLRAAGAELVEFSPLRDELPVELDGLYFGGGYPELHARELEANERMRAGVRALAAAGRPIYGECGGLMFLGESLDVDGERFEMCGALPVSTGFPGRLELAYCEVKTRDGLFGAGHVARGHRFHRAATVSGPARSRPAYEVRLASGDVLRDGHTAGTVLGSWIHLHFRSCPQLASALVAAARRG